MAKVNWEYCECGCHGSTCGNLWVYNNLKGNYDLYEGHGFTFGQHLGTFKTLEALNNEAVMYTIRETEKLKALLTED